MQVGLSSQYTCQKKQISSWPRVPVLPVRGIQLAATSDCSSKGTGQRASIYFKKRKKNPTQNTSHTWVCSASWANTIMHISAFLKKKKAGRSQCSRWRRLLSPSDSPCRGMLGSGTGFGCWLLHHWEQLGKQSYVGRIFH